MAARDHAESYFDSRLKFDQKREVVWRALWDYFFRKLFEGSNAVLELGAGWCDFINRVEAEKRFAVDIWPGVVDAAAPGVQAHVGSASKLNFIKDEEVDAVFASNLVEHLTHDEFDALLVEAYRVLSRGGQIVLVQPNFRLAYKRYFDDFTHVTMWSEVSLTDFLTSRGWRIKVVKAKFLPLTVKSRLPVSRFAIRAYLASPFKPFAGQMLVTAEKT